jgi:lysophospholipase L1-like esterase
VKYLNPPLFACCVLVVLAPARAAEPFALRDGDRVVLVGSTLIEREQRYGYWETALTRRYPDKSIIFRNLGWSGDTVFGDARAGFGSQADGFRQLKDHVLALKPTVIFIGYGTNESFEGAKGLPRFVKGLETLLDTFAPTKARIVLLSPLKQENLGPPLPDPKENNKNLRLYADAIRDMATKRGHCFVDLYDLLSKEKHPLTDNGIHLTPDGYRRSAVVLERALGMTVADQPIETNAKSEVEKLRQTIVAKNRLYFYRWRPENETYLFGFRKHEQGQNAREIPLFDPLVAEKEKEIAKLRVPVTHTYELKAEKKP